MARAAGKALRALVAVFLTVSLGGAALALAAPTVIGTIAAVLNDVRIKPAAAAQPRRAAVRQRIALGDQVQTGAASHMQALLLDRSAFTVGPNSRLTIDRFVYDPSGGSFSASVAKGALRFMSGGRGNRDDRSRIATPVATIGIRGTMVDIVVGADAIAIARAERPVGTSTGGDPERASLVVLRGPGPRTEGEVTPGAVSVTASGTTRNLDRPLLAVYVPAAGAAPIGPFTISLPGLARVNDLILPPIEAHLPEAGSVPYPQPRNDPRYRAVIPLPLGVDPGQPQGPSRAPGEDALRTVEPLLREHHPNQPANPQQDPYLTDPQIP